MNNLVNRLVIRKGRTKLSLTEEGAHVRLSVDDDQGVGPSMFELDHTDMAALKVFIDGHTQATSRGEPDPEGGD